MTRPGAGQAPRASPAALTRDLVLARFHPGEIKAICQEARDLPLADDDPLANIRLIEDPVRNL